MDLPVHSGFPTSTRVLEQVRNATSSADDPLALNACYSLTAPELPRFDEFGGRTRDLYTNLQGLEEPVLNMNLNTSWQS